MTEPLVSVIVPVFNGARFLREALDSVFSQTYGQFEVIVVDDGSTDESAAIAQSYERVRYIRQENEGVSAARNAGVAASSGALLAFLDADDTWRPGKLAKQVALLSDSPEDNVLVLCQHVARLEAGDTHPPWAQMAKLEQPRASFVPAAWLMRRAVFERVGPFDINYRNGQDGEWLARATYFGVTFARVEEVLVVYRIHAGNLSADWRTSRQDMLRMLRESAHRHQQAPAPAVESPLVSVIIPVYNGARFLKEALDSVFAQTYRQMEVIVVDDGSTDESGPIAQSYERVRYIRQKNAGVSAARNAGVAAATGTLLGFLDQDDIWLPEKTQRQVDALAAVPGTGFVLAQQVARLEPGDAYPEWAGSKRLEETRPAFVPSCWLVRREVFDHVGRFDSRFVIIQDMDWLARAKDLGIMHATVDECLVVYRIHNANSSANTSQTKQDMMKLLRDSVHRQHAKAGSND